MLTERERSRVWGRATQKAVPRDGALGRVSPMYASAERWSTCKAQGGRQIKRKYATQNITDNIGQVSDSEENVVCPSAPKLRSFNLKRKLFAQNNTGCKKTKSANIKFTIQLSDYKK